MADLKDVIRPPFANYDVVVYFGCGLFSLPFALHYIPAPKLRAFLSLGLDTGVEFADAAVATLFLLFCVYFIGHLLAFLSSLFIEKTVDILLGKMSSAVLLANQRKVDETATETIRAWIKERWRRAWAPGRKLKFLARLIVLAPVSLAFAGTYGIKWFGYFGSRIPPEVYAKIGSELSRRGLAAPTVSREWYKAAEHVVINNDPSAVPRMYNYLVISGLFRSLAFLFVCCAWMEMVRLSGAVWEEVFFANQINDAAIVLRLAIFNALFAFSIISYIKFARRYVEEMLFALALRDRVEVASASPPNRRSSTRASG